MPYFNFTIRRTHKEMGHQVNLLMPIGYDSRKSTTPENNAFEVSPTIISMYHPHFIKFIIYILNVRFDPCYCEYSFCTVSFLFLYFCASTYLTKTLLTIHNKNSYIPHKKIFLIFHCMWRRWDHILPTRIHYFIELLIVYQNNSMKCIHNNSDNHNHTEEQTRFIEFPAIHS